MRSARSVSTVTIRMSGGRRAPHPAAKNAASRALATCGFGRSIHRYYPRIEMLPILLALALSSGQAASAGRPNVVLIIADDLNVELGTYGSPIVRTPNIDRLAARGVRFDRAYSQFPVCNPSRASLLSGRRPETTGVLNNTTDPRKQLAGVTLLPEHFQGHGYRTIGLGKIAHDTFPESVSWSAYEPAFGAKQREEKGWGIAKAPEEDLPDARLAKRAARLIEESVTKGPFFLAVG